MNESSLEVINFEKMGGPVYVGRDRGESERKKYNLDNVDKNKSSVTVLIPVGTYSINSSFFLGLFGKSIRHFGSKERFKKKYIINAPETFKDKLDEFIERALQEQALDL